MTILVGNALHLPLADGCVNCVVTSPPYYGLRAYGVGAGELGSEPTPQDYVANLVAFMREIRRVLREDGVVWLNIGDAYAPSKSLMLLPHRVAIALMDDGWIVRQDNVWCKTSSLPESVRDRTSRRHEYVFQLTKSERYWYDAEAVKEPVADSTIAREKRGRGSYHKLTAGAPGQIPHTLHKSRPADLNREVGATRNRGSYWLLPAAPSHYDFCRCGALYLGSERRALRQTVDDAGRPICSRCGRSDYWLSHFAAYPARLVRPLVASSCPPSVCSACGKPWQRIVARTFHLQANVSPERAIKGAPGQKPMYHANGWQGVPRGTTATQTLGWEPACTCNAPSCPGLVFDPFLGSGTTALVADELGRGFIGLELNLDYSRLAAARRARRSDDPQFRPQRKPGAPGSRSSVRSEIPIQLSLFDEMQL